MLQLKNVKKCYNKQIVLDISSLQLDGGMYWVKGANGSGKSTLLKMIAGLIPFEGNISFKGVSLQSQPLAYRQQVSWAEAEPLFPPFMTGMDLITLYQQIRKATKEEAGILPGQFNMNSFLKSPVGTYSAGMTKKLSLILAFIGKPSLIVLDEPLITLDTDAFATLCDIIPDMHQHNGTTFLMSSHQDPDPRMLLSWQQLTVVNHHVLTNEPAC